jgi:predicted transcriptional regulator
MQYLESRLGHINSPAEFTFPPILKQLLQKLLRRDRELTSGARDASFWLFDHLNHDETARCYMSDDTLAEEVDVELVHAKRCLRLLVKRGWVRRTTFQKWGHDKNGIEFWGVHYLYPLPAALRTSDKAREMLLKILKNNEKTRKFWADRFEHEAVTVLRSIATGEIVLEEVDVTVVRSKPARAEASVTLGSMTSTTTLEVVSEDAKMFQDAMERTSRGEPLVTMEKHPTFLPKELGGIFTEEELERNLRKNRAVGY